MTQLQIEFFAVEEIDTYKSSVDSPIPFSLDALIAELSRIDKEKVPGAGTNMVNGPYYGQLTRLVMRLESKIADRRFGFLLQPPSDYLKYDSLHKLALTLAGYKGVKNYGGKGIKVIDFSEVPSEVLPVMVSLVARLVCQVQFWLDTGKDKDPKDRHPVLFICDEAHTYLPASLRDLAGIERRALESFEKIAKEGRKYGIGLMIVSQRPSDVSSTILSQCNNIIALRLTNEKDRSVVRGLLSDSLDGLLSVLPGLEVGEAIVVGDAVLLPSRIQLSKPTYEPQSASLNFWGCWKSSVTAHDIVAAAEAMRRQKRSLPTTDEV
ncbi:MAG: ATP-binding protein [Pedobacter sp.]|nr:MAG: ATP-binding protein [Pedobacter sp.]